MTQPQPLPPDAEAQQPQDTGQEAEAVATIAALLAAASAAGATYMSGQVAQAGIVNALRGLGLTRKQAGRLVELDAARPSPPVIPLQPATRAVFRDGPTYRAHYLVNAAKRILNAAAPGGQSLGDAVDAERRYFAQHRTAQVQREQAAARIDAAANSYGPLLGWHAVLDDRTTPECREADGRNFYADRPPAIGLPGLKHAGNCVTGDTVVASTQVRAATSRRYTGDLIEVTTSNGHFLSVTPGHPVLTDHGWVPAGQLDTGSYVVSTRSSEALTVLVDPQDNQEPARIADVAGALRASGGVMTPGVPTATEDFHGDGLDGEVDVVWANGVLVDRLEAAFTEPRGVEQLGRVAGSLPVAVGGSTAQLVERGGAPLGALSGGVLAASDRRMGRLGVARVLLGGSSSSHDPVSVSRATPLDTRVVEQAADGSASDGVLLRERVLAHPAEVVAGDLLDRQRVPDVVARGLASRSGEVIGLALATEGATFDEGLPQGSAGDVEFSGDGIYAAVAGLVELDRVVQVVRRAAWSGHVYNLETSSGWYVGNGIIIHNCRCYPGPPHEGAPLVDPTTAPRDEIAASREDAVTDTDAVELTVSGDTSPFSTSTTSNWVARAGGLPPRVRAIARAIHRKHPDWPLSRCIAIAINAVKYSAATGDSKLPGRQNEGADVVAAHAAAVAEWEAKRARAKATKLSSDTPAVELATGTGSSTKLDDKSRQEMADNGEAMPDGSFPIRTRRDVLNAIHAIGRAAPERRAAVKAHIIRRAKALGAPRLIPPSWRTQEHTAEPAQEIEMAKPMFGGKKPTAKDVRDMVAAHGKVPDQLKEKYRAKVIGHARAANAMHHIPPAWLKGKTAPAAGKGKPFGGKQAAPFGSK